MAYLSFRNVFTGAALLLAWLGTVTANDCQCAGGQPTVTYIVVDMPEQTVEAASTSTSTTLAGPSPMPTPSPGVNVTSTFGPVTAPDIDVDDPVNLVPATNVSLYYGSSVADAPGTINMTLAMTTPAVVLEYVASITNVDCGDDSLVVSFGDSAAFFEALKEWKVHESFVLITNHLGDCDAEFERGFFLATNVTSNEAEFKISVTAVREDMPQIAGNCEMTFSSMPAATVTKRLILNPSTSLTFSESLENNTVLYSDGKYISVVAEEAYFTSTITFSGYLNYNFWGFKLEALYFDIDTYFDAEVGLAAHVAAAYAKSFKYEPEELSYSIISVPGIVSLGPGIAFGIGVDLSASASVGVKAGLGVTLPGGNVHVDLLEGAKTTTSGWKPEYHSYANITEAADVRIDASADVTVELAIELLGGLVDLSSGLTASPGFSNVFRLRGTQGAGVNGTGTNVTTDASLPPDTPSACASRNGVAFKSDFVFSLTAFVTQWWRKQIYSTTVPVWDYCYSF